MDSRINTLPISPSHEDQHWGVFRDPEGGSRSVTSVATTLPSFGSFACWAARTARYFTHWYIPRLISSSEDKIDFASTRYEVSLLEKNTSTLSPESSFCSVVLDFMSRF